MYIYIHSYRFITKYYSPSNIQNVSWRKVNSVHINAYQTMLERDSTLTNALTGEIGSETEIDELYNCIVTAVNRANRVCFPTTKFKRFLKPYWDDANPTQNIKMQNEYSGMSTGEKLINIFQNCIVI